jgi:tRNA uridine 5-carboxymethylaminomethyl modification enzyme
MYSGAIKSRGPRYCPSIEDKIVRFADKERHQIFLEPEGLDTVEIYPNGLSTSLPLDVQAEMVHSIEGLEQAEIMRPGYAIEYDFAEPTQLHPTLETKLIKGLYHAGQINGTTGYEEAASQGLLAGINAVLSLRGEDPLIFARDHAYIGVLIDDLVTKGTEGEPYRMFTSRAEYRLLLREDNADLRLTEIGYNIGLGSREAYERMSKKKIDLSELIKTLEETLIAPSEAVEKNLRTWGSAGLHGQTSLAQLLRRPEISFAHLVELRGDLLKHLPDAVALEAEIEIKYSGYIRRQLEAVKRFRNLETVRLPENIDYSVVNGLSREAREKLGRIRPRSLGQASRISGITPAAISLLSIYLKRRRQA